MPTTKPSTRALIEAPGFFFLILLLVLNAGCEQSGSSGGGASGGGITKKPGWATKTTIGEIKNLSSASGFYIAGQPKPDDFEKLMTKGVKTVINLRAISEFVVFDEKRLAGGARLNYLTMPFRQPSQLTDDKLDTLRAWLNDKENHPILLHCGSGQRAAAVWLTHRVLDDGWTLEEAKAEAKDIGLTKPEWEQRAVDYVKKKQGG